MRRLLLVAFAGGVAVISCGDSKPPSVPPVQTPGTAAPAGSGSGSGTSLGKPPRKTTVPIARATLDKLAALAIPDYTPKVRKLDDSFLDVELEKPGLQVTVTIQPCLRCLPMELERWRAEADALRITIPPDLRDRSDTTFEVAQVALGGAPVIATYQLGFAAAGVATHAVTLYLADGVNQIRVSCAYAGSADTRDALTSVTRAELTTAALAVLERYTQAW